jgi:hypothetical protein
MLIHTLYPATALQALRPLLISTSVKQILSASEVITNTLFIYQLNYVARRDNMYFDIAILSNSSTEYFIFFHLCLFTNSRYINCDFK